MRQARSSSIRRLLRDARSRRQHRDEPHKRPLTPFSPSAGAADQPNAAHGQFWGVSALLPAGKDEALASLAAKMRLRADATSETERLWALAREAVERDRAGVDVTEATALTERSMSGLTMTKGVFALVALCSFAFGFVAVWYFLG
jgi:hypothetical protein